MCIRDSLLNEVRKKTALKVYQTVILLPYLFSMIIISYVVFGFLSTDTGLLNKGILQPLGMACLLYTSRCV